MMCSCRIIAAHTDSNTFEVRGHRRHMMIMVMMIMMMVRDSTMSSANMMMFNLDQKLLKSLNN